MAALVLTVIVAVPAHAQDSPCSYDRCALRMKMAFWSDQVVQGDSGIKVGTVGLFSGSIAPLAQSTGPTLQHYERYRSQQNLGGGLSFVGLLAVTVGFVMWANSDDVTMDGTTAVLIFGGGAVGISGAFLQRAARDHLHQAMWHYNRELVGR